MATVLSPAGTVDTITLPMTANGTLVRDRFPNSLGLDLMSLWLEAIQAYHVPTELIQKIPMNLNF